MEVVVFSFRGLSMDYFDMGFWKVVWVLVGWFVFRVCWEFWVFCRGKGVFFLDCLYLFLEEDVFCMGFLI